METEPQVGYTFHLLEVHIGKQHPRVTGNTLRERPTKTVAARHINGRVYPGDEPLILFLLPLRYYLTVQAMFFFFFLSFTVVLRVFENQLQSNSWSIFESISFESIGFNAGM